MSDLFSKIDAVGSGDHTIATSPSAGRNVAVTSLTLTAVGNETIQLKDGASDTVGLSGPMALVAGKPFTLPLAPGASAGQRPAPYLQTSGGNALVLNLTAGVQVSGFLTYDLPIQ